MAEHDTAPAFSSTESEGDASRYNHSGQSNSIPGNGSESPIPQAVREMVERGFRVFPVRGGAKDQQLLKSWKAEATKDLRTVTAWAYGYRDCNWCAVADDFLVVDVDVPHGSNTNDGRVAFMRWTYLADVQNTLQQTTRNGGHQYVFTVPAGGIGPGVRSAVLPGIDTRNGVGYFLFPPSRVAADPGTDGSGVYRWKDPSASILEVPPDLLQALTSGGSGSSTRTSSGELPGTNDILAGIAEGSRDETLFKACCRWRRQHQDDPDGGRAAVEALALTAAAKCTPPFPRAQALRKVQSAFEQNHSDDEDLARWAAEVGVEVEDAEHQRELQKRLRYRRADEEAKQIVAAEKHARLLRPGAQRHAVPAGDAIWCQPAVIPARWGTGDQVLLSRGEGGMLSGPQGAGKSTIAQQLVLHMIGVLEGDFLGFPVAPVVGKVMYLAMDRPQQALRSMRRMVTESQVATLNDRMLIWQGPPPIDPLSSPSAFADWVQDECPGVEFVVIDSTKDLAAGLSKDEVAAALNSSWQELIARDVDLLLLHHPVKSPGSGDVTDLNAVYGSTWLTAGLGSVFTISGEAGDQSVTLTHVKQPAEVVGPITVQHNRKTGLSVHTGALPDLMDCLDDNPNGLTVTDLAIRTKGDDSSSAKQAVSRRLKQLAKDSQVVKIAGQMTSEGRQADVWRRINPPSL